MKTNRMTRRTKSKSSKGNDNGRGTDIHEVMFCTENTLTPAFAGSGKFQMGKDLSKHATTGKN